MEYLVITKECSNKIYTDNEPEIDLISFKNKEDAEYYLKNGKKKKTEDILNVFTDGACSNNGRENAKGGIGIYFDENDPRNVSESLSELYLRKKDLYKGIKRQTNNIAELSAIIEVFEICKEDIKNNKKIIIYSDSKIAIGWCTSTGEKYEKMNWKKKKGEIPNLDLIKKAYHLMKENINVSLEHIKAHTGLNDYLSKGNEKADYLANMAIGLKECPYSNIEQIIDNNIKNYLNVPFSQKEDAKELGCKWDKDKKKWFYYNNINPENIEKLEKLYGSKI